MNNEELSNKMTKIATYIQDAQRELNSAKSILSESINFDNDTFKGDDIDTLNNKLGTQIDNINKKIMTGITSQPVQSTTTNNKSSNSTPKKVSAPNKVNNTVIKPGASKRPTNAGAM